jgi:hypothetical protein
VDVCEVNWQFRCCSLRQSASYSFLCLLLRQSASWSELEETLATAGTSSICHSLRHRPPWSTESIFNARRDLHLCPTDRMVVHGAECLNMHGCSRPWHQNDRNSVNSGNPLRKTRLFSVFFLLWDCFQLVYSVNGSNARSSTMTMQHPSHEKGRLRHLFDGQFRRQRSDGGEHQRSNMHFSPSVTHVSNNRMFTCSHLAGSSNSVEHRVRLTLISTHRQHCRCEHASTSTS